MKLGDLISLLQKEAVHGDRDVAVYDLQTDTIHPIRVAGIDQTNWGEEEDANNPQRILLGIKGNSFPWDEE